MDGRTSCAGFWASGDAPDAAAGSAAPWDVLTLAAFDGEFSSKTRIEGQRVGDSRKRDVLRRLPVGDWKSPCSAVWSDSLPASRRRLIELFQRFLMALSVLGGPSAARTPGRSSRRTGQGGALPSSPTCCRDARGPP